MKKPERRSSVSKVNRKQEHQAAVGARQIRPNSSGGVSGYQDECTAANNSNNSNSGKHNREHHDPRIGELIENGLSWRLVAVAEAIGYDSFIMLWRVTTTVFSDPDRPYSVRVTMPSINRLKTIERNRLIMTMASSRMNVDLIRNEVVRITGRNISERQVYRILRKFGYGE